MSFTQLNEMLDMEHEVKLMTFLQDIRIIAKQHACKFCGGAWENQGTFGTEFAIDV